MPSDMPPAKKWAYALIACLTGVIIALSTLQLGDAVILAARHDLPPGWATLLGNAVGAAAVGLAAWLGIWFQDRHARQQQAAEERRRHEEVRSIAAALAVEVDFLLKTWADLVESLEKAEANIANWPEHQALFDGAPFVSPVFDAHVGRLGHLPPAVARAVMQAYGRCSLWRRDEPTVKTAAEWRRDLPRALDRHRHIRAVLATALTCLLNVVSGAELSAVYDEHTREWWLKTMADTAREIERRPHSAASPATADTAATTPADA